MAAKNRAISQSPTSLRLGNVKNALVKRLQLLRRHADKFTVVSVNGDNVCWDLKTVLSTFLRPAGGNCITVHVDLAGLRGGAGAGGARGKKDTVKRDREDGENPIRPEEEAEEMDWDMQEAGREAREIDGVHDSDEEQMPPLEPVPVNATLSLPFDALPSSPPPPPLPPLPSEAPVSVKKRKKNAQPSRPPSRADKATLRQHCKVRLTI